MAIVFTIIQNPREADVLKLFFESISLKVEPMKPTYAGCVSLTQYRPSFIFIEIPPDYINILNFVKTIKKNKLTKITHIIGYGSLVDQREVDSFKRSGLNYYFKRPLQTEVLKKYIKTIVPKSEFTPTINSENKEIINITKTVLDPHVMAGEKIDILFNAIGKLMAFPFTVAKVLKITQSSKSGANDLAQAIEIDPVISATVLRISNSVLFASRNKKISTIKDAIIRIGFSETKNITVSLSVINSMGSVAKNYGFNRVDFWYNSLACAIIAEKLVRNIGIAPPEEAFLAGLLNDFGIILLDEFFGLLFSKVMDKTTADGTNYLDTEKDLFGFNSFEVVAQLFEKWKLPQNIIYSIKKQNSIHQLVEKVPDNYKELAQAVFFAKMIAKSLHFGKACDLYVSRIPNTMVTDMKFPVENQKDFFDHICSQLNMYNSFLNLDDKKFEYPITKRLSSEPQSIAIISKERIYFDPVEHYFSSNSFIIQKVNDIDSIKLLEITPELVVVHTETKEDTEWAEQFLLILNKEKFDNDNPDVIPYIPALVLQNEPLLFSDRSKNNPFYQMEYGFELRLLDYIVEALFEGKKPELEKKKKLFQPPTVTDTNQKEKNIQVSLRNIDKNILIMEINGNIKTSNIKEFRETLFEILQRDENVLAINLEKISQIDSTPIGLLVNFKKKMANINKMVCILNAGGIVLETFTIATLDKIFPMLNGESELLDFLKSNPVPDSV